MKRSRIQKISLICLTAFLIMLLSACGREAPVQTAVQEFLQEVSTQITAEGETAAEEEDARLKFAAGRTFAEDLPDEDLPKPGRVITSLDDYIYALDYMAFYRISEKVFFEIDPVFAEEIYNPYTVHQKAYEMADLADVYACQMDDAYYSQFGVVGIKYSMSRDIASEPPAEIPDTRVLPSFDYRAADGKGGFEPDFGNAKGQIRCENSEQLYYLVMNGYRPLPEKDSMAEQIYEEACRVLDGILSPDMTGFEKIKAVYDWLTTEVFYDKQTAYSSETYLVKERAYYLEGVFLHHCAVCDGKAKACALLLNLAGVPCLRTTGVNEGGDHAWNMVCLDGTWYICCTTYGQVDMSDSLNRIVPDYSMLLAGKETPYEWYPAQKHKDIEAQLSDTAFDCYGEMGRIGGLSLKIGNVEEVAALLTQAAAFGKEEYKVGFVYTGDDPEGFEKELTVFLESYPGTNAARIRSEKEPVYQVFVLQP